MVTVHPLIPASFPVSSSPVRVSRPVRPAGTVISTWLPVTKPSVSPLGSVPEPVTRRLPANRGPVWVTVISLWPSPRAGCVALPPAPCRLPVVAGGGGACVLPPPAAPARMATPITRCRSQDMDVSLSLGQLFDFFLRQSLDPREEALHLPFRGVVG